MQLPTAEVWILNLQTMTWESGPPLPIHASKAKSSTKNIDLVGYFKGTAYCLPGNNGIIYSGGASLKINKEESGSNQIYEYVPNTKVLLWRFDGTIHTNSWKVESFCQYCTMSMSFILLVIKQINLHHVLIHNHR